MRILLVGAGGVGSAMAAIGARRDFFELMVVADYSAEKAARAVSSLDERFVAAQLDAASAHDVARLCRARRITHVVNAVDPRFVMPIFNGAFAAGADYLDLAMSLSDARRGVMLGGLYFAVVLFGWPIILMSLLGLLETIASLRARSAARRPPPTPTR